VIEPISLQHGYRSSHGLLKVESITREWNGVSVTYNAKYPGPGVAYADLSSEKTTVVVCLEQKGGMCEPRLKVDEATPRTRYDMGYPPTIRFGVTPTAFSLSATSRSNSTSTT
jgi:hypothetical protein